MILDDIVSAKQRSLNSSGRFVDVIQDSPGIELICELKLKSPTHSQPFVDDYNSVLRDYKSAGVKLMSVVTDGPYFGGELGMVTQARSEGFLVLRKDFIIEPSQIAEVYADALLLIARILEPSKLKELVAICQSVNIEPVVEIHSEDELNSAQESGARVIAVNTRDLDKQEISFNKGLALLAKINDSHIKLLFSGINSNHQVKQAQQAGADAVLVGTSVLTAGDRIAKIAEIRGSHE